MKLIGVVMPGSELIKSLVSGLDVLVLLAESEQGLRLKEIAEKMDMKSPAMHNILRTLKSKGFVTQKKGTTLYHVGPHLEQLAAKLSRYSNIDAIEKEMLAIASLLPQCTITFTQISGGDIVVKRRISPEQGGVVQKPDSLTLALYGSASGLTTLAFCSEEDNLLLQQRHVLLEEGAHIWTPAEKLDAYLDETRRRGYAIHPCSNEKRFAISAPVYDADKSMVGVLGVATATRTKPIRELERKKITDLLMKTAKGIF